MPTRMFSRWVKVVVLQWRMVLDGSMERGIGRALTSGGICIRGSFLVDLLSGGNIQVAASTAKDVLKEGFNLLQAHAVV